MKKIDLRKQLRELYTPSPREAEIVKVPKFGFLMIDGQGDPNTSQGFRDAVQALYAVAYTLKFMIKKEKKIDYPVMALEGLWWADDMAAFAAGNRAEWKWTLMILQPTFVTKALVKNAIKQVQEKKELAALGALRFSSYVEGLSVQILHVGPYSLEAPTIERLHNFAKERGYELHGKHHEIYMSDPRRVKPGKMKTVIRQPVRKASPISKPVD